MLSRHTMYEIQLQENIQGFAFINSFDSYKKAVDAARTISQSHKVNVKVLQVRGEWQTTSNYVEQEQV